MALRGGEGVLAFSVNSHFQAKCFFNFLIFLLVIPK